MKYFIFSFIFFLPVHNYCFGQAEKTFGIAIAPMLGFNASYCTFSEGYQHRSYQAISGNSSTKDVYYGLGLQFRYLEDWQFTVRYARSFIGAGYRRKTIYFSDGTWQSGGYEQTSSHVNILDGTFEKRIIAMPFFKNWHYCAKLDVSAMFGMRYISIPKNSRSDTLTPLPSVGGAIMHSNQLRPNGTALTAGLSAQLFVRGHRSLKVGALYSYLIKPIIEYQSSYTATSYNRETNRYETYTDNFHQLPGRHQILFFAEYPINVFRIKY